MASDKHFQRVVGHVSGWQEQMGICVCGNLWPCIGTPTSKDVSLVERLRDCARAWAMEQTLKGIHRLPEDSYDWTAAEEIERLTQELDAKDDEWKLQEHLKDRAVAEVERLQRELADARKGIAITRQSWINEANDLRQECDRLQRERDLFFASLNEVGLERDRLRAALQQARDFLHRGYYGSATTCVDEALFGPPSKPCAHLNFTESEGSKLICTDCRAEFPSILPCNSAIKPSAIPGSKCPLCGDTWERSVNTTGAVHHLCQIVAKE